jgi:glutaminyl-tRNA synthetase
MPTLCGLRRRGFTADAIRNFILGTGLSRVNSTVESDQLDEELRNDLKLKTVRPHVVMDPIKVIIDNYPEGQVEVLDCVNNPENEELGSRKITFSREVYIEREDFIEEKPNKKWKRLALGVEVRLMHAYFITANSVEKDEFGNVTVIHATYDPATKSGSGFSERKPNGNIHFVDASTAVPAEFRLFEPLMLDITEENKDLDFMERLNPESIKTLNGYVEESLKDTKPLDHYQFVRNGYYVTDLDSKEDKLVFNRTCGLKSSFKL